ncbi:2Fe-2S iron-sulfur cluster-binding protein [Streptomyces jumonjinensis]|uniref:(2Fe-2S)-binding protein n=1 Tax=Streptomyces jumonjinensis TaxID=1945 RepID=UPI00379B3A82
MSNEENPHGHQQDTQEHHVPGHGGWQQTTHGDYDYEATAFVQLPPEDALGGPPLEAPGHGYVPPMILPLTPAADPQVPQVWQGRPQSAPGPEQVWPEPAAEHPMGGRPQSDTLGGGHALDAHALDTYGMGPHGGDGYAVRHEQVTHPGALPHDTGAHPGAVPHDTGAHPAGDPHATGQWAFPETGQPGHPTDVTGQWTIPVARGDLPEETGEFTTSVLRSQWGTAPATLPGGAPAPWAADAPATLPGGAPAPWATEPAALPDAPVEPAGAVGAVGAVGVLPVEAVPVAPGPAEVLPAEAVPAEAVPVEAAPMTETAPEEAPAQEHPAPAPEAPAAPVPELTAPEAAPAGVPSPEPPAGPLQEPAQPQADAPGTGPEPGPEPVTGTETVPATDPDPDPVTSADPAAAPPQDADAQPGAAPDTDAASAPVSVPADPAQPQDAGTGADAQSAQSEPAADAAPEAAAGLGPAAPQEHPPTSYVLRVNGTDRPVTDAWIGESLLYVLRERLGLAGAKDGCSQGECGACNVQVDGRLVASCLVPAATTAGSEIRTVEGLAADGEPSDVQRALAACGAVQCGFCIPGMAMTVHDLLEGNHHPTELEARQALCGNLCRCSGYRGVLDAVREVAAAREASAAAAAEAMGPAGPAQPASLPESLIPHQAPPGAGSVQPHPHDGGMA